MFSEKNNIGKNEGLSLISISMFIGLYLAIRGIERFVIPAIPDFVRSEFCAFLRWGPFLAPLAFGAYWMRRPSGNK